MYSCIINNRKSVKTLPLSGKRASRSDNRHHLTCHNKHRFLKPQDMSSFMNNPISLFYKIPIIFLYKSNSKRILPFIQNPSLLLFIYFLLTS